MATTPTSTLSPHLVPMIHTFSTPDLIPILARSNLPSMSSLLSAFESGVERVTVRSSTYEAKLVPRFPVRFIERSLPIGFGDAVGEGSVMGHHNRRASTAGQSPQIGSSNLPHFPSALEPSPSESTIASPPQQQQQLSQEHHRVSISFSQPTQAERDELFLDSLSSLISQKAEGWIVNNGKEELAVRANTRAKRKGEEEGGSERGPVDEGWEDRRIEELTPWYTSMRDEILKRREMVEWETFAWPVGSKFYSILPE